MTVTPTENSFSQSLNAYLLPFTTTDQCEKEIKQGINTGKGETKLSLFSHNVIINLEHTRESTEKLLEQIKLS